MVREMEVAKYRWIRFFLQPGRDYSLQSKQQLDTSFSTQYSRMSRSGLFQESVDYVEQLVLAGSALIELYT